MYHMFATNVYFFYTCILRPFTEPTHGYARIETKTVTKP